MCQDDRRYGRNSGAGYFSVSVGTTAVQITQPNPYRLSLVISAPSANRITVGSDPMVSDLNGMVLYGGGGPLPLDIIHHGDIVTGGLWAIANTGTNTVGIMQVEGNSE